MRGLARALAAEEQFHRGLDAVALFPAHVVLQGAMGELARRRTVKESLRRVLRSLSDWHEESRRLRPLMNRRVRDDAVKALEDVLARNDVDDLTDALEDANLALQRAKKRGAALDGPAERVRAAKLALRDGKARLHGALEAVLELEPDFPEVVRYLDRAIPHDLLPKWHAERTLADFVLEDRMTGSRHVVWRAQLDGQTYAVKVVSSGTRETWLREASRLLRAAHPHVVELLAVFEDHLLEGEPPNQIKVTRFCIQMPWCRKGALNAWITNEKPDPLSVRRVLAQTFDAVRHLHSLGILHCDIKPENILVGGDGRARLADFDVARDTATRTTRSALGFTQGYDAPELLRSGATEATDSFSLGKTVELVAKDCDMPGEDDGAGPLVARLTAPDPGRRPRPGDALADPFFAPVFRWQESQWRVCCLSTACEGGRVALPTGLECGDPEHFVCADCLADHVANFVRPGKGRERAVHEGKVPCPAFTSCRVHFSEWALAQALPADTFATYSEARLQLLRDRVWLEMEPEVQRQVQAEVQRLERMDADSREVLRHVHRITEEILNLKCPRCGWPFVDFEGCFALACAQCPCHFCAWCLADCGGLAEAHRHVRQCPQGTGELFNNIVLFRQHHDRRRRQEVAAYLDRLAPALQERVRQEIRRRLPDA